MTLEAEHKEMRLDYEADAQRQDDENLKLLLEAHRSNKEWRPGGFYFEDPMYRIWMRAVRREARWRGLV